MQNFVSAWLELSSFVCLKYFEFNGGFVFKKKMAMNTKSLHLVNAHKHFNYSSFSHKGHYLITLPHLTTRNSVLC